MRIKLGLAAALALSAIAMPAAVEARDYHGNGYSRYHHDGRYDHRSWGEHRRWEREREHRRWERQHRHHHHNRYH